MNAKPKFTGSTALVPRATIEEIVEYHDKAIDLYDKAFKAIEAASEAIKDAHAMARRAAPLGQTNFSCERNSEIERFHDAVKLPDAAEYARVARKLTALQCWAHVVTMTDLERLMDKEAKDQLRSQMRYVPDRVDRHGQLITEAEAAKGMPPLTVDNIYATLDRFRADAGMIFRRGIANAFSKLDRRFKSHDGFKIGSRIIVTRMFNESGSLSWGGVRDTLIDIERVFSMLDGNPEASFQSTLYMIEEERQGSYRARQSEHENEYFKVRCYQNGNAHLWFRRPDLVLKVNKLLAEYYGETIADGQTAEDDPLDNRKTTLAKNYGFFPTPEAAVNELFENNGRWNAPKLIVLRRREEPRLRILEPSAGTGNLARRCISSPALFKGWAGDPDSHKNEFRFDNIVDCVEFQAELAARLNAEGLYNRVICADFLALRPEDYEPYDLVVTNPPWDRARDIDHVTHAMKFLKPDGALFAIMSAGTEFRDDRKTEAFRALMKEKNADWRDLPPGSFAESGTYANAIIVSFYNDGKNRR